MTELQPGKPEVKHIEEGNIVDKSPELMDEAERIAAALDVASSYGRNDDGLHKTWTIDQMVRILTGSPLVKSEIFSSEQGDLYTFDVLGESEAYQAFVADHNHGDDGPHTNDWDTGIAP